jgi:hypothetical protein
MIRINLLRQSAQRQHAGFSIPKPLGLGIAGALGALALLVLVITVVRALLPDKQPPLYVRDEEHLPSSLSGSKVVEEPVREVRDMPVPLERQGFLNMPYEEMRFPEKVNYEILFARKVFELLATTMPEEIGLREVKLRDYDRIYCRGRSSSRDSVVQAFTNVRAAPVKLHPKPQTYIRSQGNDYVFAMTATPEFGLDLQAPFLDLGLGHLPSRQALEQTVRRIIQSARESGIRFSKSPTRSNTSSVGHYRRFYYQFSGNASFEDFVTFVRRLHDKEIPCAFRRLNLKARNARTVSVSGELVITTHE